MFIESRLKLYWARRHAYDLSAGWQRFVQVYSDPVKWREFNRANSTDYPQHHVPVPVELRMMLGDCIRCMRSSLDYLVSALAREAELPDNNTVFPFAKERKGLEASFEPPSDLVGSHGKKRRAGALYELSLKYPDLKDVILDKIKPYSAEDGAGAMGDLVWRVVTTDNIDKHRLILITTSVSFIRDIRIVGGGRITGGTIIGDAIRMGSGELEKNSQLSVDMQFGEPARLSGKPVTRTLVEALNFTGKIIEIFESHF
ncbi:MAG: hypothetical protein WBA44_01765 [Mesorhizobium sp.]